MRVVSHRWCLHVVDFFQFFQTKHIEHRFIYFFPQVTQQREGFGAFAPIFSFVLG